MNSPGIERMRESEGGIEWDSKAEKA